jgi:hypothetical protein
MPTSDKVYVVTSGSYSDYGIVGVFDNAELAQLTASNIRGSNEVEVYELNPDADKYLAGLRMFVVLIAKDGTVKECELKFGETRFLKYGYASNLDEDWLLETEVWAKDAEHAIKVANERRSYLLAENLWPDRDSYPHSRIRFPWEEKNADS